MKNKENLKITGEVNIKVTNTKTKETKSLIIPNLVVETGRDWIASVIGGTSDTMTHIATGSGTTAHTLSDTTLESEIFRATASSNSLDNTVEYAASYNVGETTGSIREAGIFNASSGGIMLCRTTFGLITIGSSDSMSINWTITIS